MALPPASRNQFHHRSAKHLPPSLAKADGPVIGKGHAAHRKGVSQIQLRRLHPPEYAELRYSDRQCVAKSFLQRFPRLRFDALLVANRERPGNRQQNHREPTSDPNDAAARLLAKTEHLESHRSVPALAHESCMSRRNRT